MRAFIKRDSQECKELLMKVDEDKNTGEGYFDVAHFLHESNESFHGVISDTRDSFNFKDARLPAFELPLQYVELDE